MMSICFLNVNKTQLGVFIKIYGSALINIHDESLYLLNINDLRFWTVLSNLAVYIH